MSDFLVREFPAGGDMVFVLPPFLDVGGAELLAGDSDTVTVAFVVNGGALISGADVEDFEETPFPITMGAGKIVRSAGDQWVVTVPAAVEVTGRWEIIATSSAGAKPQRQVGLWGSGPSAEILSQIGNITENLVEYQIDEGLYLGAALRRCNKMADLWLGRERIDPATGKKWLYPESAPTLPLYYRQLRGQPGSDATPGAAGIGTLAAGDVHEAGEAVLNPDI